MTWDERLDAATRRGWFTKEDKDIAQTNDGCSLGERVGGLSAGASFEDIKSYVSESSLYLGIAFTKAVKEDNVSRALQIHNLLRDRGAALSRMVGVPQTTT